MCKAYFLFARHLLATLKRKFNVGFEKFEFIRPFGFVG